MRTLPQIVSALRPGSWWALVAALVLSLHSQAADGQGLAQVNLSGVPPVLSTPLVSDLALEFEQGRYPMTFVYNSPDRQPVEFTFRVLLEREGQVVLDITSDPVEFRSGIYTYTSLDGGPHLSFPVTYGEIIDALGAALDQDLGRTGLLSEGFYTVTVQAVPTAADNLVIAVPGSAMFSVQYLEPPVLLGPLSGEVVREGLPVFSWLPVIGAPAGTLMDYEFLLVEVYPGQVPTQAIEANRPIENLVVTGVTTLPYTTDRLPLEAGRRYAWQVTARADGGLVPLTDDGRSEIETFVYAPERAELASWEYPYSRPPVVFNLSGAELTGAGYLVTGSTEGWAGGAPVSAYLDDVILDSETLDILSGRIVLLDATAEGVGLVESDALHHLLLDDTPPTQPFATARLKTEPSGESLSITVGPSEDPESGIRSVQFRLAPVGSDPRAGFDIGAQEWSTIFSTDTGISRFEGASLEVDLPEDLARRMEQTGLDLAIRVANGLDLESLAVTRVGSGTDLSPPVVVEPDVTYAGYYDPDRPNAVEVAGIQARDVESDIRSIEYRTVGPGDRVGEWIEIASPGSRSFRTSPVVVQLPQTDEDATVQIEFQVTNEAGLVTSWHERIDIDIDETQPVLSATLARFVTSESDPRIEIARDAVADYQSGVRGLSYRVVDDRQPTRIYVDWRPFPPGPIAEVKRTQLNFTTRRTVRVEVQAQNRAGLEATFAETLPVPELRIGDRTPPLVPDLSVRVVRSDVGAAVLELVAGPSSDPETGVSRVQYRVEDAVGGSDLTGWIDVGGVSGGDFGGFSETVAVRPPEGARALRVVVRVVNGAGGASTASAQAQVTTEDLSPPQVRSMQVYAQAGRVLAFVDGLADAQSSIAGVDFRILDAGGNVLTDWVTYPIVPAGRPSYGRQLLRADVPSDTTGSQLIFQLRVRNGAGLETVVEESVAVER